MKIFGASSFAAYLYSILAVLTLMMASAAGAAATDPLIGTWQNISYEQSGGKYWTDTAILNSDYTYSITDVASDGSGSCAGSGTYSYTSTTITITATSSATTGNAGCTPVGTFTLAYTISGSGIGSKFIQEDGYTYTKISEPSATASPLIGTWSVGDEATTLAFDDNGNYTLNQITVPLNAQQLQVWPGIETGAYSWDAATGALVTACPTVDNNGTAGLSDIAPGGYTGYGGTPIGSACAYSTMTSTLTVNGNTATWILSDYPSSPTVTLTRITPATSPATLTIAKSGTGSGTITSSPAGIDCGATCSASFTGDTTVTLTATPASGSTFFGWGGACSGAGSCVVTMDAAKNVTAIFKPVPFVATTIKDITPTSATISTTVSFAPADLGKTGAVYVTAWTPASGLSALGILSAPMSQALSVTVTNDNPYTGGKINTRQESLASVLAAADPNAFVLVQLTSSGWQLVENGQLIPYASGVLGDQMSALSILNNTDPSNLLGAQFCVGYGTSAAEMVASGRMMPVADIPGATVATNGSCNVAANPYKGLWWNPAESGWGMSVTQHDTINFVALYTYDQNAQPVWYVMSNCPIVSAGSCTGDIYQVVGGKPPTTSWVALDFAQALSTVGSGTLTFSDTNNGKFDFTLNGVTGSKTIQRQMFSSGTAAQALDYTDLWWNANESGWGVALTQDVGMIFAAWYTYDAAGLPVWYVASSCPLSGSGCTGEVYRVTGGEALTAAWNGYDSLTSVGSVSFAFSDSSTGTMSYTIDGVAGSRAITRQPF